MSDNIIVCPDEFLIISEYDNKIIVVNLTGSLASRYNSALFGGIIWWPVCINGPNRYIKLKWLDVFLFYDLNCIYLRSNYFLLQLNDTISIMSPFWILVACCFSSRASAVILLINSWFSLYALPIFSGLVLIQCKSVWPGTMCYFWTGSYVLRAVFQNLLKASSD